MCFLQGTWRVRHAPSWCSIKVEQPSDLALEPCADRQLEVGCQGAHRLACTPSSHPPAFFSSNMQWLFQLSPNRF
eukprot:scaffold122247_cov19-Tisochrysis_lutea.AAC.1